ncbi:hypothetical protein [Aureimonas sp. SK2]|uniref:hypothetical protein n=1 Tax=Aureimonas sp. SK2 TaxID=3015992 RepID=UPI002444F9B3|nr:hypothetical protein [Aureimonas sp. SK2]
MTWADVCRRVARDIQKIDDTKPRLGSDGKGWTRQALARHLRIQEAYELRSTQLQAEKTRTDRNPRRNHDPEVVVLRRERDAIRQENEELRRKLAAYEERFSILTYNKALGAQSEEEMARPLPKKFDRQGRT